jgi:hypothetical protein
MAAANADQKSNAKPSHLQCSKDTDNDSSVNKEHHFEMMLDKAFENETGFNKEQRTEALSLLMSTKFTSDIHDLVLLILSLPPKVLNVVPLTTSELLSLPKDLSSCLTKRQCVNNAELIDIADSLYKNPGLKLQRETMIAFLDNQSFRLALIAYARTNGIDIRDEDLTLLQTQLKNEKIDIESLLNKGQNRLKEKYNVEEFEARLACLGR